MRNTWPNLFLAVLSAIAGLTVIELGYRVWEGGRRDERAEIRVVPRFYSRYDASHGERFEPGGAFEVSVIRGARVVGCMTPMRANRDGLGGRTTFAEYRAAEVKVLVFGDSFSHWQRRGVTWPDLLEERLARASKQDVKVLNFARGGYGILQMFDLAADAVEEWRPDVAVFAFIRGDLARARWWFKRVQVDGVARILRSTRPDDFSLDHARDKVLLDPAATPAWCREQVEYPDPDDPVLVRILERHARYAREFAGAGSRLPRLRSLERVLAGRSGRKSHPAIPEVSFASYAEDARFLDDVRRLKRSGTRLELIRLPTAPEIEQARWHGGSRDRRLIASLEESVGQKVAAAFDLESRPVPRAPLNLAPLDGHPSYAGLAYYGRAVADYLLQRHPRLFEAGAP